MKVKTAKFDGLITTCAHRVTFSFWGFDAKLTPDLESDLAEEAEERASAMIAEGCHSGELNYLHTPTDEEIRGWWKIEA